MVRSPKGNISTERQFFTLLLVGALFSGGIAFVGGMQAQQGVTVNRAAILALAGGSTQCDSQYDSCKKTQPEATCRSKWNTCVMGKCSTAANACNMIPECQTYCTESATSQGGLSTCCKGGPKIGPHMPNPCPDEVDGKCNPKKTDGMMGMPPMLPMIPMGMGGMPMPMMPGGPVDCSTDIDAARKRPECEGVVSPISDVLKGVFGTTSASTTNIHAPSTTNTDTAGTSGTSGYTSAMSVFINWLTGGSNDAGGTSGSGNTQVTGIINSGQGTQAAYQNSGLGQNVGSLQGTQTNSQAQTGAQGGGGTIVGNSFTSESTFGNQGGTGGQSGQGSLEGTLSAISTSLNTIWNWLANLF